MFNDFNLLQLSKFLVLYRNTIPLSHFTSQHTIDFLGEFILNPY